MHFSNEMVYADILIQLLTKTQGADRHFVTMARLLIVYAFNIFGLYNINNISKQKQHPTKTI